MIEEVVPTKPALAVAQVEGVIEAMERRAKEEGEGEGQAGGKSGKGGGGGAKFSVKLTGMELINEIVTFFKNMPTAMHQLALNLASKTKGFAGMADLNKVAQTAMSLVSDPVKHGQKNNPPSGPKTGPQ